ncbi:MAG: hypothetical protein ACRDBP_09205 [Luteolibacter sp.]
MRWLEHRFAKGGEVRSLPERLRDAVDRAAGLAGAWLPEALLRTHVAKGVGALGVKSPLDRVVGI